MFITTPSSLLSASLASTSGPLAGLLAPRRRGLNTIAAASLAVAASLICGPAVAGDVAPAGRAADTSADAAIAQANGLSKAFRHATRTIQPSVVSIEMVKKAPATPALRFGGRPGAPGGPALPEGGDSDPNELFRRFFGGQLPPGMSPEDLAPRGRGPAQPLPHSAPEMRGEGSGVIMSADGYIITNNHVVNGADELTVKLDDGSEHPATIVGVDPETDLALIKIEGSGLPFASFGDSEALESGDWVVAVGSPYGLDHTVTAGIVSAKQRRNMGLALFEDFIQTDAAINPGNSGGPLVNLHGEVIGINTAIRSGAGGNDGIGFAIPATTVKSVMEGLKGGKVERGYLGIRPQMLDQALAKSFGFTGKGVVVSDVVAGQAGEQAGLRPGDIITKVDGKPVDSPAALVNAVAMKSPQSAVALELFRDRERETLVATLGSRPGAAVAQAPAPAAPEQEGLDALGLRAAAIDDAARSQFNLGEQEGVVVTEVAPDSRAAKAGLESGDVILNAGGHAVKSMKDFAQALDGADESSPLRLRVKSGDAVRFLVIR